MNSQRNYQFGTTPDIILKAALSLLVGTATWYVADLASNERKWTFFFSTFVGSMVLIVQFMIEFERRLKLLEVTTLEHNANMTALVQRRFGEISNIAELFSLVETSAMRSDVAVQFLRHAVEISDSPRLRYDFAHAEIARMSQFLRELGNGIATYPGEDRDWLLALTRSARQSINAISLPAVDGGTHGFDDGFWESDLGNRYLECQGDAAKRGVGIRRIFVLDDPATAAEESFQDLCLRHESQDILVRLLSPDSVPPAMSRVMLDFIIFDDAICYEVTPGSHVADESTRPIIVNTRLVLRDDVLRQHHDHFEILWNAADPFEPDRTEAGLGGAQSGPPSGSSVKPSPGEPRWVAS